MVQFNGINLLQYTLVHPHIVYIIACNNVRLSMNKGNESTLLKLNYPTDGDKTELNFVLDIIL